MTADTEQFLVVAVPASPWRDTRSALDTGS